MNFNILFFQIISNEFLLKQLAEQITHKQQCPIEIFIYYTKQIKIEMQSKAKQNKTKTNIYFKSKRFKTELMLVGGNGGRDLSEQYKTLFVSVRNANETVLMFVFDSEINCNYF